MSVNPYKILILAFLLICCSSCYDHIPSQITGIVIDNSTGLPINGVLVKDLKSGHSAWTDKNGRFNITGIVPKQKIDVSDENYLPFYIEITEVIKRGQYNSKSFSIPDKNYMNEAAYEIIEPNSHNFSVVNGNSLIIRLRKK